MYKFEGTPKVLDYMEVLILSLHQPYSFDGSIKCDKLSKYFRDISSYLFHLLLKCSFYSVHISFLISYHLKTSFQQIIILIFSLKQLDGDALSFETYIILFLISNQPILQLVSKMALSKKILGLSYSCIYEIRNCFFFLSLTFQKFICIVIFCIKSVDHSRFCI